MKIEYKVTNYKDIPIFITSYNRLDCLQRLITFLEQHNYNNIYIIDNNSSYPPLLEFLKNTKYKVYFMKKNYGHKVFWECGKFNKIIKNQYYVVTDPDVLPVEECPDDFLEIFYKILMNNPSLSKVGFSLKINDIPEHYDLREYVIKWEKHFYDKKYKFENIDIYDAEIDTTFALYRPNIDMQLYAKGIRTGYPYECRHLPWYKNSKLKTDEDLYYIKTVNKDLSLWAEHLEKEKFIERMNYFFSTLETPIDRSKIYSEIIPEDNNSKRYFINWIKDDNSDNIQILDVGCACGDLAYTLKKEGCNNCFLTGMEYNEKSLEIARSKKCYESLYQIDLNNIDIDAYQHLFKKFDYIIFGDILEHIYEPKRILNMFKYFLKKNGHILISLPNIAHCTIKANLLNDNFEYYKVGLLDETHIRFFTYKTIASLLSDAQLKVQQCMCVDLGIIGIERKDPYIDLPKKIKKFILKDPHSFAFQYVLKCRMSEEFLNDYNIKFIDDYIKNKYSVSNRNKIINKLIKMICTPVFIKKYRVNLRNYLLDKFCKNII